jgi:hypothetical protein
MRDDMRPERKTSTSDWRWRLAMLAFAGAALYHAFACLVPGTIGGAVWRHGLFVLIDSGIAVGLAYRPPWFLAVFAVLTCQVIYAHGGYGWRVLKEQHRYPWYHWGVTLTVIAVFVMLSGEAYQRPSGS